MDTESTVQEKTKTKLELSMFNPEIVLGQGHFGQVLQVRFTEKKPIKNFQLLYQKTYAIKIIKLPKQIKQKQVDHLFNEKKAL